MNSSQIKTHARKAYEWARFAAAVKFASVVLPIAALSFLTCGSIGLPLILSLILAAWVIGLKWRGQEYGEATRPGLISGIVAFAVPVTFHILELCCRTQLEVEICLLSGALGGAILGKQVSFVTRKKWKTLAIASMTAILTGSLGCASLAGAVTGLVAALVLSAIPTLGMSRRSLHTI